MCVMADPEWMYPDSAFARKAKKDLNTIMETKPRSSTDTTKHLQNLCVPSDTNSLLFVWTTTSKLDLMISLTKAWGYEWRGIELTWVKLSYKSQKIIGGPGWYSRSNVEYLVVFSKGPRFKNYEAANRMIQHVTESVTVRPSFGHEYVLEQCSARKLGKPLEMFARGSPHPDFEYFLGDQITLNKFKFTPDPTPVLGPPKLIPQLFVKAQVVLIQDLELETLQDLSLDRCTDDTCIVLIPVSNTQTLEKTLLIMESRGFVFCTTMYYLFDSQDNSPIHVLVFRRKDTKYPRTLFHTFTNQVCEVPQLRNQEYSSILIEQLDTTMGGIDAYNLCVFRPSSAKPKPKPKHKHKHKKGRVEIEIEMFSHPRHFNPDEQKTQAQFKSIARRANKKKKKTELVEDPTCKKMNLGTTSSL
ncbi:MAG: MT-A70 family methyltransferase [Promethearchaeota archaeon]